MRKVCEIYLVSSGASDERGVELTFPVSQYEMMDAFEQIHTKSPGDVYWQVDEFYCFDYLSPHLDESASVFEFNSLTAQLSKLDEQQEIAMEGLLNMAVQKHMQENSGPIMVQELMMLASNVDHCHVLADIHTDEDLGKFYVENGFRDDLDALPDSAYALLDYAKIGKQTLERSRFPVTGFMDTKKTQMANSASFQNKQKSCANSTSDMRVVPACAICKTGWRKIRSKRFSENQNGQQHPSRAS